MRTHVSLPALVFTILPYIAPALAQFSVIALRSGTPIHLQPVTASGLALWLIEPTASFCPLPVDECPPGVDTAFLAGGGGTLIMDVEVPGGQQAYVNTGGSIGYTVAHSAEIPAGADTTGFNTANVGGSLGSLGVTAFGATGFAACPTNGVYQIFANIPGIASNCIAFDAATFPYSSGAAAWEYT